MYARKLKTIPTASAITAPKIATFANAASMSGIGLRMSGIWLRIEITAVKDSPTTVHPVTSVFCEILALERLPP
jgi:hypothetical protein